MSATGSTGIGRTAGCATPGTPAMSARICRALAASVGMSAP